MTETVNRNYRKIRQGTVVSTGMDKGIIVRVDRTMRHKLYGKIIRSSTKFYAHDEKNEAGIGDVVRIMECRPLSKLKRWRLMEITEKAK